MINLLGYFANTYMLIDMNKFNILNYIKNIIEIYSKGITVFKLKVLEANFN